MKPPSLPATPWTEHYETLRQHVLEGSGYLGAEPLGMGLVYRCGLRVNGQLSLTTRTIRNCHVKLAAPRRDPMGWIGGMGS